jgi:hypothetical protein
VVGVAVVGEANVDGELVEGVNCEFDPELLKLLKLLELLELLELLDVGDGTLPPKL